jgi:hypothetical protein
MSNLKIMILMIIRRCYIFGLVKFEGYVQRFGEELFIWGNF